MSGSQWVDVDTHLYTNSSTLLSAVCDKEAVVQQLVQVLSVEGDSINTKVGILHTPQPDEHTA